MRATAFLTGWFFLASLTACTGGATKPDPVGVDSGRRDAAAVDARIVDASGLEDALSLDAEAPLDARTPDASVADAGFPDATAIDATADLDAQGLPDAAGLDAASTTHSITIEVSVPASTPATDTIYVAGSFQGWNPNGTPLTSGGGLIHRITLELENGPIEFKFTRGEWSKVEKGPNGEEIANRTLNISGSGTHAFTVARWADSPSSGGTRVGDITETQVPGFLSGRRVWIYLPPGYAAEDSTQRHPVLYMLDGQNLFDHTTSYAGEWRVDEALEAAIPAGTIEPLIVVGIDNGGDARIDEYTPWIGTYLGETMGGQGQAHLEAIVNVLKPWVDANFRTLPTPEWTGISGSSLGGLMSVYAGYRYPSVFGKVGALSPSIWWADEELVSYVTSELKPEIKMWVDMGALEGESTSFGHLVDALLADGFVEGTDLHAIEIPGVDHEEAAWAARFPDVLEFLFPR